ncbi:MAG: tripartite tricarboxylate transporter TctB family protein [Elioraea tepidiphila]
MHPHNLLFLQPTAVLVVVLWAIIALACLRGDRSGEAPAQTWPERLKVLALVGTFGLFILGLERIGYDIAAWAFVTVALAIGGERRPLMLALFPPVFVAAVIVAFKAMIPYPLVTAIL